MVLKSRIAKFLCESPETFAVQSDRSIAVSNLPTSSTSFEINHSSDDPNFASVIVLLVCGVVLGYLLSCALFNLTVKYPVTLKPVWLVAMLLPYIGCYLLTEELHAIPTFYLGEVIFVCNFLHAPSYLLQPSTSPWIVVNISSLLLMLSYDHVELTRPWIQTLFSGVAAIFRMFVSLSFSFAAISAHDQSDKSIFNTLKSLGYCSYWQTGKLLEWFIMNLSTWLISAKFVPKPIISAMSVALYFVNMVMSIFVWSPMTLWDRELALLEKVTSLIRK